MVPADAHSTRDRVAHEGAATQLHYPPLAENGATFTGSSRYGRRRIKGAASNSYLPDMVTVPEDQVGGREFDAGV
jgi:hypothetical protein